MEDEMPSCPILELGMVNELLSNLILELNRERNYAQALLEEKKHLEAASSVRSEFLGAVSHQLRIPLTGIMGMAQLLHIDCLLPGQKEQVEDILKASEHLLSLVNDLLDLTKLESGKLDLHPAVIDLKVVIEEIANLLYVQMSMKGLEIVINYEPDVPKLIVTDARIIRQILLNLINNAIKYTEKGFILVQVKCLQKKAETVVLEFRVQDTGVGIAEQEKNIIFDRFSQRDRADLHRYNSTGLGLILTKHFVEVLGGNIWVESEKGKGSTFIFTIPFDLQNLTDKKSPWEPYKSKVNILIVDDALKSAVLYKHIVSPTAKIVAGKEALQALLIADRYGEPFDVVIIDQQLINLDAMQLGQTIHKQITNHRPMLLLLMSPNQPISEEEAKAKDFFTCFVKPLQPKDLMINLTTAWKKWLEEIQAQKKLKKATRLAKQPQILLVEDDVIIQKVHKKMLENSGCKVDLAKDGQEALDFFQKGYDLIFMDVGLPGISGIEVTKKIRQQESVSQKHTPIIAMTAFVHEEDKSNCLAAGMDEVATKPISLQALKNLLARWLKKPKM